MTNKDIIDAYSRIRTIDNTIPDEVLDFMKDAALEKLSGKTYKTGDSFSHRTDQEILDDLKRGTSFGMKG